MNTEVLNDKKISYGYIMDKYCLFCCSKDGCKEKRVCLFIGHDTTSDWSTPETFYVCYEHLLKLLDELKEFHN